MIFLTVVRFCWKLFNINVPFSLGNHIFVKIVVFIPDLVALMLRVLMSSLWLLYSCCFQCFPILIKVSRIILNWFVTQGKSALQAIKCRKILGNKDIKIFVLILVMKNPLFIILLFLNTEVQFSNTIAKLLLKQNKLLASSEAVFWSQDY